MIFVNFKTYEEGTNKRAESLVGVIEDVSRGTEVRIIPVVQAIDLKVISSITSLEIWVQHVDNVTYGAHTGWVLPEAVRAGNAKGTFLNHSEHPISIAELRGAIQRCREVSLKTLVFAADLEALKSITSLYPDYVSYEPAELVGSTTTSVATAKPEIIAEACKITKEANIPLIVGAGIHSKEDVRKSLELGAAGVAVATNIVKAEDQKRAIMNLLEGFQR
jgi:triosephosphate isomerase